ncbi:MAG: tRNA lysidine(34) synthetase TilS [Bacteroidota bacterium]
MLHENVSDFLFNELKILPESKLLLAVSGGIDSMAMLELLSKHQFQLAVAHCNFQLRSRESDADESLVKRWCHLNNIAFFVKKFDTEVYAKQNKMSIQMAARDLRYRWFDELSTEHGFDYIAIAHNADDSVETFFLNLARGTGLRGLTGMQAHNGKIIRPLLRSTRREIGEFVKSNAVVFREDASNAEDKYKRNHVRHNIIPPFLKLNPSFLSTMIDTMNRLAEAGDLVEHELGKIKKNIKETREGNVIIPFRIITDSLIPSLLLLELLQPYGFTAQQVNEVLKLLQSQPGKYVESPKYQIFRNRDDFVVALRKEQSSAVYHFNTLDELKKSPFFTMLEHRPKTGTFKSEKRRDVAELDADKIIFPVILRHWKQGDCFVPFGMKGRKKLSDFFTDLKLSKPEKDAVWILESNGHILWVVGYRLDDRFKITEQTQSILKIVV